MFCIMCFCMCLVSKKEYVIYLLMQALIHDSNLRLRSKNGGFGNLGELCFCVL